MTEKPPILEVPKPLGPVRRGSLIAAAVAAADAVAAGAPLPEANTRLVNRSFELRLPFGCDGPSADMNQGWAGWSYDAGTRALKLVARTESWSAAPWLTEVAPDGEFDAVEGFWVHRPWTASEACPPRPPADDDAAAPPPEPHPDAVASAGALPDLTVEKPLPPGAGPDADDREPRRRETLAIARFVAPGTARTTTRGDRPYAITLKQDEGYVGDPAGYRLVLSGRITGFRDGQPVHCWNESAALRPVCVVAAAFDRVAFEDSTGAALAEWRQ